MSPGDFINDATRNIKGHISSAYAAIFSVLMTDAGAFALDGTPTGRLNSGTAGSGYITCTFESGRVVPTAYENRPASISHLTCITY